MSASVRNEHPTAVKPSSYVMRGSVVLAAEEHGLRPETQNRTDLNASRQGFHRAGCHADEQFAEVTIFAAMPQRATMHRFWLQLGGGDRL
jgi:hypothetical protein